MSKSRIRSDLRAFAAVAAIVAGASVLLPPLATAGPDQAPQPEPKPVFDTGSAIIDGGSSVINGCVQDPASCIGRGLDAGSSVLGTGSSVLGLGSGSSNGFPQQSQPCNRSTKSGGAGVTTTSHSIGRSGPTSFVLTWDTESIPDEIVVFYEGAPIANTGYVGGDVGTETGAITVNVPAGAATAVSVRVTGPSGTVWEYTVNCPV